jgi:hypothetical protein
VCRRASPRRDGDGWRIRSECIARLVEAFDPWLDQVLIIGVWAHRLYRRHPHAQPLGDEPLEDLRHRYRCSPSSAATGGRICERLLEGKIREELWETHSRRLRTPGFRAERAPPRPSSSPP